MRVVLSAYLRLLIFLLAILIPACASSSPAFLMMYSAYKLNKQDDNIQPCHTPFPIWNQSVVPCPVLTVASWPAYRFLRRQVRWSGILISLRIFHSQWEFAYESGDWNRDSITTWGVGWGGRWEWGLRMKGHMYTYGWLMLIYGRNQQNSVKQFILQLKNK